MKEKPKPYLIASYCKGCGRCIDACPKGCIHEGTTINSFSGLIPVELQLDQCNGCGLCLSACPEPYGLRVPDECFEAEFPDFESLSNLHSKHVFSAAPIPDEPIPLMATKTLVIKGMHASAIGALLAGCRHFFGYPITPSTEGAELMAKLLPELNGIFVQAVSEVATVNFMYGCAAAGLPCMTFTSSPGFSLMLEGLSYMIGAELPAVFVNVMRGGPGLGNIGPEQADIKLACRGLGHGNTHAIVLAPSTPQEMLDLTILSFNLTFKYRNPVVIVGDGYMGQMTGKVNLPECMNKPGIPEWAVYGDEAHRGNLISSIQLSVEDLEAHNIHLNDKYDRIEQNEQRSEKFLCRDADVLLVACNTPARMAKGAVRQLRNIGISAGLFRPITLWPFPIEDLASVIPQVKKIVMVEAGSGQLENEMRLALSRNGIACPPVRTIQHSGGVLPQTEEIVQRVRSLEEVYV
ncbi:MAG TPA: 3-methyl-2-oxobutanoate dehydrogenase subunit VorB [Acidobacteriota bacterium]|nr:3-methyl-2-oxobutanoate dehydrogenase subunit VorB [Acidobacteriota bacterium]